MLAVRALTQDNKLNKLVKKNKSQNFKMLYLNTE